MIQDKPKISIITASKNDGRFLRQTIESILNQSFTDYEHIVVDGVSTDNTIELLKKYKHIKWISEPDRGAADAFYKALSMCRGEYIMLCCVSDGYLDRDWFKKCIEFLDNNQDISLVYGLAQQMTEDDVLGKVVCSTFINQMPPQKMDFLPFWLGTYLLYSESTYCVRARVYKECFFKYDETGIFLENDPVLSFNYNFNVKGYLPHFIPVVASYGRYHKDSVSVKLAECNRTMKKQCFAAVDKYRNDLLSGKIKHYFRDGDSNIIGAVSSDVLKNYRKKILHYQLNRSAYLGKKRKISLSHQIKKLRILINYYLGKN